MEEDLPFNSNLETLFGKELLTNAATPSQKTVSTVAALKNLDAIVIYFSNGPVTQFTPMLIARYKALKSHGKKFEVIYLSKDANITDSENYFQKMPWLALPFENKQKLNDLVKKFSQRTIPYLCILDGRTLECLTTNGVGEIKAQTYIENFPYYPLPVNDICENKDGLYNSLSLIAFLDQVEQEEEKSGIVSTLENIASTYIKNSDRDIRKFFVAKSQSKALFEIREEVYKPSPV